MTFRATFHDIEPEGVAPTGLDGTTRNYSPGSLRMIACEGETERKALSNCEAMMFHLGLRSYAHGEIEVEEL